MSSNWFGVCYTLLGVEPCKLVTTSEASTAQPRTTSTRTRWTPSSATPGTSSTLRLSLRPSQDPTWTGEPWRRPPSSSYAGRGAASGSPSAEGARRAGLSLSPMSLRDPWHTSQCVCVCVCVCLLVLLLVGTILDWAHLSYKSVGLVLLLVGTILDWVHLSYKSVGLVLLLVGTILG